MGTDEFGGYIIPPELQAEFEKALSMPVYPPQPEGTTYRPILGKISGDIIVCPSTTGECDVCGKADDLYEYHGTASSAKLVCCDCESELRVCE